MQLLPCSGRGLVLLIEDDPQVRERLARAAPKRLAGRRGGPDDAMAEMAAMQEDGRLIDGEMPSPWSATIDSGAGRHGPAGARTAALRVR